MTKNPFINALAAGLYIAAVVFVMTNAEGVLQDREDTPLMPMAMLSLFVLSAAVMSYIFVFQPLQLFLENKKKEGVDLFLKTVGAFAGVTVIFWLVLAFFI